MSATPVTNAEPIHRWVICFAGFCQDEGENIGVARLWRKLVQQCNGPNSVVLMREWHQPVSDLAGLIAQFNGAPDILICGYSYGGQTAANLARALQRRKIGVRQLVLVDAVFRPRWYEFYKAFWPDRRIRIPTNVRWVRWFRQRVNWPAGHELVAINPARTKIAPAEVVIDRGHDAMDELPEFHEAVLRAASLPVPARRID